MLYWACLDLALPRSLKLMLHTNGYKENGLFHLFFFYFCVPPLFPAFCLCLCTYTFLRLFRLGVSPVVWNKDGTIFVLFFPSFLFVLPFAFTFKYRYTEVVKAWRFPGRLKWRYTRIDMNRSVLLYVKSLWGRGRGGRIRLLVSPTSCWRAH